MHNRLPDRRPGIRSSGDFATYRASSSSKTRKYQVLASLSRASFPKIRKLMNMKISLARIIYCHRQQNLMRQYD